MCGFLQPAPFVQKIYPTLYSCHDGFVDRLLLCTPKPHLLQEAEVEEWAAKLQTSVLKTLGPVYEIIERWHFSEQLYELSKEARAVYIEFADELTKAMNSKWDDTEGPSSQIGNVSKDRRVMIR